jgi:hypothetical protein
MKDRSIGKRIALAFAAAAIGFVTGYMVFLIFGLFFYPGYEHELVGKAVGTLMGLGLMVYLTHKWSGKMIALIAAAAVIIWIILQVVVGGTFMWSNLSMWPSG